MLLPSYVTWQPNWLNLPIDDCQFGYIKKSTKKKFEELGGQSLILLQIQHQFTIRCLFITFGGKQLLDDQG